MPGTTVPGGGGFPWKGPAGPTVEGRTGRAIGTGDVVLAAAQSGAEVDGAAAGATGVAVGAGVGDGLGAGVGVGLTVGTGLGLGVGEGVAVGVAVGVGVGLGVGDGVGLGVGVDAGVGEGDGVGVAVWTGVGDGVTVAAGVAVGVTAAGGAGEVDGAVVAEMFTFTVSASGLAASATGVVVWVAEAGVANVSAGAVVLASGAVAGVSVGDVPGVGRVTAPPAGLRKAFWADFTLADPMYVRSMVRSSQPHAMRRVIWRRAVAAPPYPKVSPTLAPTTPVRPPPFPSCARMTTTRATLVIT